MRPRETAGVGDGERPMGGGSDRGENPTVGGGGAGAADAGGR